MPVFINSNPVETGLFAGGECHVSLKSIKLQAECEILAELFSANDVLYLLLTVDAVRRINPKIKIALLIPYFPYARQDRVCNPGEAFSASVMAELINNLHCESVTVLDPHSDVTTSLLRNCKVISQAEVISRSMLKDFIVERGLTLLAPDAGAERKAKQIQAVLAQCGAPVELMFGAKTRNPLSGEITGIEIKGAAKGKNILLVDDICDGGRTFIEVAKQLKASGAANIYLYTTHGIYARGLDTLKKYFRHIYCYHDMRAEGGPDAEFLTVLEREFNIFI